MAWTRRTMVKAAYPASSANTGAFLDELADTIVSANSDWSHTPAVEWLTGRMGVILTHTSGAQIVIAVAYTTNSPFISTDNGYGSASIGSYGTGISFKPSSKVGSYLALTAGNNPSVLANYVSGVNAYPFQQTALGNSSVSYNANSIIQVLAHNDSATLIILFTYANLDTSTYLVVCADDDVAALNFEHLEDPTDDEPSFLMTAKINDQIPNLGSTGVDYNGIKLSFRTKGDLYIIEGAQALARIGDLDYTYQDPEECLFCEQFTVTRTVTATWLQGRKGLIDPRIINQIRSDAELNFISKFEGNYMLHVQYGCAIAWQPLSGPIL